MTETNSDLYSIKNRLVEHRQVLRNDNNKYVELNQQIDALKTENQKQEEKTTDLMNRLTLLEQQNTMYKFLNQDDISKAITEWSKAELKPILDEILDDCETCFTETKLMKEKLNKAIVQTIDDTASNTDIKQITRVNSSLKQNPLKKRF